MWTLEVFKADLAVCRIAPQPLPTIAVDTLLVQIESLAFTANTMTYAALGDSMRYWSLFPGAADGWGRIPAWGHGRVVGSAVDGINVGDRLFGLFPMASHVVLAGRRSRLGLRETSPWRSAVSAVYNQYALSDLAGADERDVRAVFQPLFVTSFVLARHLIQSTESGLPRLFIVSASSKTALGTAFELRSVRPRLTGLTSPRQADWVRGTGLYDTVVPYDQLELITSSGASLVVDFSGDEGLVDRICEGLGQATRVLRVGWTHGRSAPADDGSPSASKMSVFFGPSLIERLAREWGASEFDRRLNAGLASFGAAMSWQFSVDHRVGEEGTASAYREIQRGSSDASELLIARPT